MGEAIEKSAPRRLFHGRALVSFLTTCSFLVMVITGIVLYFSPQRAIAQRTDWTMWGLDREQWMAVHINSSWLFVIAGIVHLAYNWRPLWGYVKRRAAARLNRKLELALAAALTAILVAGTLVPVAGGAGVPPFSTIIRWREDIKAYWRREAPRGHRGMGRGRDDGGGIGRGRGGGGGMGRGGMRRGRGRGMDRGQDADP